MAQQAGSLLKGAKGTFVINTLAYNRNTIMVNIIKI